MAGLLQRVLAPLVVCLAVTLGGVAPARAVVAFSSDRCDAGNCQGKVWTIEDDGSNLRQLTDGGPPSGRDGQRLGNERDGQPTWSPGAASVAFTREGGYGARAAIHVVGADGSGLRRLSPPDTDAHPLQESWPDWSPLGLLIAFVSNRPVPGEPAGNLRVWVSTPDGSVARPVTDGKTFAHLPRFTPDGLRVMYTELGFFTGGSNRLMSIPVAGGPAAPVVAGNLWPGPFALAVAPDGRTLGLAFDGPAGNGLYLLDTATGAFA